MREVTVTRVLDASPPIVSRWLDPATIVEGEGSFTVETIDERADATVVIASGPGMQLPLRFEDRENAIYYTQEGEQSPFSHMKTWIEIEEPAESTGTRVTIRSSVSLAAPLPFGDRIAGWKRSGELERLLDTLEEEVG
ncbi:SRPBCC family protein [Natronorubrum sp. JWXQ-INN-674]|uniref:SRPBCC family protein n=1 Tax=Natronorubrum halalkaliphilum TaxID=2691917 RepID=A0A6B0VMN2_9EURY|nr:SRPBCC family protein [Natronorubrum halalkaliphilum]MXV63091.1 SRPBCC family protein [Natronorubrum halalkaliphilum]